MKGRNLERIWNLGVLDVVRLDFAFAELPEPGQLPAGVFFEVESREAFCTLYDLQRSDEACSWWVERPETGAKNREVRIHNLPLVIVVQSLVHPVLVVTVEIL